VEVEEYDDDEDAKDIYEDNPYYQVRIPTTNSSDDLSHPFARKQRRASWSHTEKSGPFQISPS